MKYAADDNKSKPCLLYLASLAGDPILNEESPLPAGALLPAFDISLRRSKDQKGGQLGLEYVPKVIASIHSLGCTASSNGKIRRAVEK